MWSTIIAIAVIIVGVVFLFAWCALAVGSDADDIAEEIYRKEIEERKDTFVIPHPGTGEWIEGLSFEEAMEKWFEGFNIPRKKIGPNEVEDMHISIRRIHEYVKKKHSQ